MSQPDGVIRSIIVAARHRGEQWHTVSRREAEDAIDDMSRTNALDDDPSSDLDTLAAVLTATRELLWGETPSDIAATVLRLVERLGGTVVAAQDADDDALPVDISFGQGEPTLPRAPVASVAHLRLTRHIPAFVRTAHRALELVGRTERLVQEAEIDPLTGLPTRRRVGRALGRLQPGDVVVMLDLDGFKQLNDTLGHQEGDRVLRVLGRVINDTVRARDHAGRYGGEEFVIVLPAAGESEDAEAFVTRLHRAWESDRPHPVTFSAGIAIAGDDPSTALSAADAAMYDAKRAGGDHWMWAGSAAPPASDTGDPDSEPVSRVGEAASPGAADASGAVFVASSHLRVPDAGREDLVAAFEDRLGEVDDWPGFRRLEVWADRRDPTAFVMVSWWDDEDAFRAYMASASHRRSHGRIVTGELRPRPDTFLRYEVVAR